MWSRLLIWVKFGTKTPFLPLHICKFAPKLICGLGLHAYLVHIVQNKLHIPQIYIQHTENFTLSRHWEVPTEMSNPPNVSRSQGPTGASRLRTLKITFVLLHDPIDVERRRWRFILHDITANLGTCIWRNSVAYFFSTRWLVSCFSRDQLGYRFTVNLQNVPISTSGELGRLMQFCPQDLMRRLKPATPVRCWVGPLVCDVLTSSHRAGSSGHYDISMSVL